MHIDMHTRMPLHMPVSLFPQWVDPTVHAAVASAREERRLQETERIGLQNRCCEAMREHAGSLSQTCQKHHSRW